jgi:8-oxo-dGTP diphosphatase
MSKNAKSSHIVAVILEKGRKLFLCRRTEVNTFKNFWQNPGGKVEKGESLLEAIVRETKEETGLQVDPQRFQKLETRKLNSKQSGSYRITTFRLRLRSGEVPQKTESKHGPWRVFTRQRVLSHQKVVPGLQKCLTEA